jgi:hypothetical protein
MIASSIGKKFLQAYNQQYQQTYSAKTFFHTIYFPLFFDHDKYAQWVTNSPFVQGIKKGVPPTAKERQEKLAVLSQKISNGGADASIAIGYPSLDIIATTSGQLTNMILPVDEEDTYYSWIGSGLGVGIQGGMSILFDNTALLLHIFDGWQHYRNALNEYPKLRGNQINTWNGQWLAHRYDPFSFVPDDPMANFNPFDTTKDGIMEVNTISWVQVLIGIAMQFDQSQLMGYVYNLGQTNTTIGFIPFVLPNIRYPIELYKKLIDEAEFISHHNKIESLLGSAYGFIQACRSGTIGIKALEPKGLRDFMPGRKDAIMPNYNKADQEKTISFNTYKIWLLAMLKNETLWELSQQAAQLFIDYEKGAEKAKRDRATNSQAALDSTKPRIFINSLIPILKEVSDKGKFEELAKTVAIMPDDNFLYFLTLIRFNYALNN